MNNNRRIFERLKHPVGVGMLIALLGIMTLILPAFLSKLENPGMRIEYADVIAIFAIFATIALAIFSVMPTITSIAETSRSVHYSELDSIYNHLLELAVEHPFLRNPEKLESLDPSDERHLQYKTYAFMVWNFLETIHDRCERDKGLRGTWAPVIAAEFAIHHEWFWREISPFKTDTAKFCIEFCDFIWSGFDNPNSGEGKFGPKPNWINTIRWNYRSSEAIWDDKEARQNWIDEGKLKSLEIEVAQLQGAGEE